MNAMLKEFISEVIKEDFFEVKQVCEKEAVVTLRIGDEQEREVHTIVIFDLGCNMLLVSFKEGMQKVIDVCYNNHVYRKLAMWFFSCPSAGKDLPTSELVSGFYTLEEALKCVFPKKLERSEDQPQESEETVE